MRGGARRDETSGVGGNDDQFGRRDEQEFYFQGTANVYNTPSLATSSIISSGHPYLTRMLVRRPADPKQFNGTVLVEWLNITMLLFENRR